MGICSETVRNFTSQPELVSCYGAHISPTLRWRTMTCRSVLPSSLYGLAALALVAACTSAETRPTLPDPPQASAALPTQVDDDRSAVPTAANECDGDQRIAEPATKQARRTADVSLATWVMPLGQHRHPRVASQAEGSISLGTVTAGYLVDAVEMPVEGTNVRVLDKVVARQTRYTTHEMAQMLLCAADKVAKVHPGHKLQLGNLSRQTGGALPWSVSHNNGRDADVAFYARTAEGKPASMALLYHFDRRGKASDAPEPLSFDVPANWTLVKSMIECYGSQLQFLFVADWLSYAMLAHAQKQKEDKKIVMRAAALMVQPKKAMAHNDHLHVRIGCARDDSSEGCVDASRAPQAAWGHGAGVRARLPALRAHLVSSDPQARADAVYLLGVYRDSDAFAGLIHALRDPSARVRLEAIRAVGDWKHAASRQELSVLLGRETDARCAAAALQALADMGAEAELVALLRDDRAMVPSDPAPEVPVVVVRAVALKLLAEIGSIDAARAVVALLDDKDTAVRDTARRTIERMTSFVTPDLLADLAPLLPALNFAQPLEPANEKALWTKFFELLPPGKDRDEVAMAGFARHGIEITHVSRASLPALVQGLAMPAPWRDTAARWIERAVQFRPAVGKGARATPQSFWSTFLVQRRILGSTEVAARFAAALFGEVGEPAVPGGGSAMPSADVD